MSGLHHFSRTKNNLEWYKRVCGNKDFCKPVMLSEDTKIIECNQKKKSDKAQFTIYSEFKCLIEKFDGSKNNPQNSFTAKV